MTHPTISLTGYYQDRFSREMTDGIPLEHTPAPIPESWLRVIGNTAGFIVFVLACIALMCVR